MCRRYGVWNVPAEWGCNLFPAGFPGFHVGAADEKFNAGHVGTLVRNCVARTVHFRSGVDYAIDLGVARCRDVLGHLGQHSVLPTCAFPCHEDAIHRFVFGCAMQGSRGWWGGGTPARSIGMLGHPRAFGGCQSAADAHAFGVCRLLDLNCYGCQRQGEGGDEGKHGY